MDHINDTTTPYRGQNVPPPISSVLEQSCDWVATSGPSMFWHTVFGIP